MDILFLVVLAAMCVCLIEVTSRLIKAEDFYCLFSGALTIVVFFGFALQSAVVFNTGSPITEISVGHHKVAFVYRAGDNVNLGIERPDNGVKDREHIFMYQLPIDAFDNKEVFLAEQEGIPVKAKGLSVIQNGDFRKLHLVLK